MDLSHPQYKRSRRVTIMTTRMLAAWSRSMGEELGLSHSAMCHWLLDYAIYQLGSLTPAQRLDAIKAQLGPTGLLLLQRDLDKGADIATGDDVPWR